MLVAKIGVDTGADRNIDIPTSILGTDIKDMGNTLVLNVVNGPTGVPDPQPIVTALVKRPMQDMQMQELKLRDLLRWQGARPVAGYAEAISPGRSAAEDAGESGFQGRHPRG